MSRRTARKEAVTVRYGGTDVPLFRPSLRRRLLLLPALCLVRLWSLTLRLRFEEGAVERCRSVGKPAIFLFWHNHIFLALIAKRRFRRPYRMSAIASTSRDGAWPAAIFSMLGTTIIRGSSHTRGVRVAREMLAVHRSGQDLCLTPDGSRGPIYHLRPGPVFLSEQAGSPLLLFSATFHRAWRLDSWDRFYLPKPFSRVDLRVRLIQPEELAAAGNPDEARDFLEGRLLEITEDPLVRPGGDRGRRR
ncbi:MAG: lysophospholipid acyltransferase family protein [Puniceicoccaceae bacterium]